MLLVTTPFDARTHLDGARLAALDLARGLVAIGAARPVLLARPGWAPPPECDAAVVDGSPSSLAVLAAIARADVEVVHALFAPRRRTALALFALARARRVRLVQTLASSPRAWSRSLCVGDVVVATSRAAHARLVAVGVGVGRLAIVPLPFAPPSAPPAVPKVPRDLVLDVGDLEFGGGLATTLDAFARIAPRPGAHPALVLAGRRKTPAAARIEQKIRGRARLLGEVPSLLPWIAGARCVLLAAVDTFAKIDHPRALLESIALGTRVIVGPAPSLGELVEEPSLGEVTVDRAALTAAIERAFERPPPDPDAIARVLAPRHPSIVAAAYAELYRR